MASASMITGMGPIDAIFLILMVLLGFAAALDVLAKKGRQALLDQLGQRLEKLFSRKRGKEERES